MSAKKIIEIRNLLENEIRKTFQKEGAANTGDFLKRFKSEQSTLLEKANDQLVYIALNKLMGDIRQRKKHALWTEPQKVLFSEFAGLPQSLALRDAKGNKISKSLPNVTFAELDDWLHAAPLRSRADRHPGLASLLNAITPYARSGDSTVEEAFRQFKSGSKPERKKA